MGNIQFGTGGFRAIIGDGFTKENVQKVCQAICNLIDKQGKQKNICIGYDNRFMSENFAVWAAEVFARNDINVELMDSATTTPVVMFATKQKQYDFGLMITASHNPSNYNGLKVFIKDGRDAGISETKEIENEMENITEIKTLSYEISKEKIKLVNYLDDYIKNIINVTQMRNCFQKLKIVYDAKFGSSVEEIKLLHKYIGISDYTIINGERDAFFGGEQPSPTPNNIEALKKKVIEIGADIGFALDADGDRLAVVDKHGNYIDNNYILAVIYYYLVNIKGEKGDSVKNVATSNLLDRVTEKLGYVCHEVPVGFKWVSSAIIEKHAVIGGESSGGLAVNGHIWGKDSLIAIAFCLKAMNEIKKPFHEILKEVTDFAGGYSKVILDTQYQYLPKEKINIDKKLFKQKLIPSNNREISKTIHDEYVKIYYTNGDWSVIRFSGTEPILRIFVESDSVEECKKIISSWESLLNLGQPMLV